MTEPVANTQGRLNVRVTATKGRNRTRTSNLCGACVTVAGTFVLIARW